MISDVLTFLKENKEINFPFVSNIAIPVVVPTSIPTIMFSESPILNQS
ncbi:MAG: hypothetical protein QXF76_00410 [Candidatus Anstonellales archaeon]